MIPCVGKSDSAVVFLFVCACVYNVYIICLLICSAGSDITENINDKNVFFASSISNNNVMYLCRVRRHFQVQIR